jgi:septal ring factor EnvC (AmiA/AmiB activator)
MTPELWWEIAKYLLGGFAAVMAYLFKGMDTQIKALWKKVDALQEAENAKKVDMSLLNLQVTTLTSEMSGVKEELKKLNTQSTKLDVIVQMLEDRKSVTSE